MLDEDFLTALGRLMFAIRQLEETPPVIRRLVSEDVLELLSEFQLDPKFATPSKLEKCLFGAQVPGQDPDAAYEDFRTMLVARDFRIQSDLAASLIQLLEQSVSKFRPLSQRDQEFLRRVSLDLRRL